MSKETQAMRRVNPSRRRERGQILILFVLAIVVIVGLVGLVLDGGAAYAQRRAEQGVADLASMAGATAYLNTTGDVATKTAAADAAARSIATANGYTDGVNGATVDIVIAGYPHQGVVRANITGKHQNSFVSLLGMPTWDVSVTAAAETGDRVSGAMGAMPLLFNAEAFPGAICDETAGGCTPEIYQLPCTIDPPATECKAGTGNEDVPQDATQFNWTIFCMANGNPCNANSDGVREIIEGDAGDSCSPGGIPRTPCAVMVNDQIGPLNSGAHTTLFKAMESHIGDMFPVPIVTDEGQMVGFAYFKLLAIEGGSEKVLRGYFVSPVNGMSDLIVSPDGGGADLFTGAIKINLID